MKDKQYVICGGTTPHIENEALENALRYHLYGQQDAEKLTLDIPKMRKELFANIPTRFEDLLNIATYVFTADQSTTRGRNTAKNFDNDWYRSFHFFIPVRNLDFWQTSEVIECLQETLSFLSDDKYEFTFTQMTDKPSPQEFLNINEDGAIIEHPERVIMFSGGLDSPGGAVQEIAHEKKRVFLVNHLSSNKGNNRYRKLEEELAGITMRPPHHVRIKVQKQKRMNKDPMQRCRSFLFVSLGATIANLYKLNAVRFYENGVISLNLPTCAQVVGGRATRTTHPRVMAGFQKLLSLVADTNFVVDNPFLWKTKADVVRGIVDAGHGELIQHSVSCTHIWLRENKQFPHCGTCSQCIDRRFATIAAGAENFDPLTQYSVDIFLDGSEKYEHPIADRMMFATYVNRANNVARIDSPYPFLSEYPEVRRTLGYLDDSLLEVSLERAFELYKKHAGDVAQTIKTMLARHTDAIMQRTLPPDALLRIVFESRLPQTVSAPATTNKVPKALPANIFRKCGETWDVRFQNGKLFRLIHTDGCTYLFELLTHQNEQISASAAYFNKSKNLQAKSSRIVSDKESEDAGIELLHENMGHITDESDAPLPATDDQTIAEVRAKKQDCENRLKSSKKNGNQREIEELTTTINNCTKYISATTDKRGKPRNASQSMEVARSAFSKAVKSVLKKIKTEDTNLASHLQPALRDLSGEKPGYFPKESVEWITD